jgi:hypothetical protein
MLVAFSPHIQQRIANICLTQPLFASIYHIRAIVLMIDNITVILCFD